ncbi:MAG TPA: DUF5916 domain-containing protein [Vicinamibacterales bacterium]|nr:DUF5916 domain-containing protein [Vicinamibacterales bacterium]
MQAGGWRAVALVLLVLGAVSGEARAQARPDLALSRAAVAPRIDGILDEAAWRGEPLALGEWRSYEPLRGDAAPERTEVRATYDDRFIYFAFHCLSDDPRAVRTTLSKRDAAFSDDWVGLSLDSTGSGQSAYHLMVNPSGVQMDAVNSTAAGEKFESDFVWFSAGARTADGYVVELALPLETIRFSAGPRVAMGILFWRHVSRSGVSYSWPDLPAGQWVFDRHAHLVFTDLAPRRLFELLPSATWPLSQARISGGPWSDVRGRPEAGLSVKYGITSQVTVDATVNPDFSQVESDAFQVQVNQRFPTFFSEKRPFFMEGLGLFNVAGTGGDYNMRSAVHTRRIVNPSWGAKVTGAADRLAFGVLAAADQSPGGTAARGTGDEPHKQFTIGRLTYGLGGSNYAGGLVTDTYFEGRRNQVIGGDLSWKPSVAQTVTATALFSRTSDPRAGGSRGSLTQVSYRYDTRRLLVAPLVEHADTGFRADTAFYNRTGFTSAFVYSEINFYPQAAKRFGIIRVHPLLMARRGHDDQQGGDEDFLVMGTAFNFNRQGFLRIQHGQGHEPWAGTRFRTGEPLGAFGGVQLVRWLHVGGNFFRRGWSVFYDPVTPFQGRATSGGVELIWQPTMHFNQAISYDIVRFSRADSGARVFTVDIVNAKTVYQFNTRFFVRLLEQFDSSRHQLLTDVLASYEVVPGTVFHGGYGALYERGAWQGEAAAGTGSYAAVNRGLFFKASYLHRF